MLQFNDLPELVLSSIIEAFQNSYMNDNFLITLRSCLPLLAINQKCRQVGLPKLYSKLVFRAPEPSNTQVPTSNISLFAKPEYRKLVTHLDMLRAPAYFSGSGIPHDLFEFMMRDVIREWIGVGDILPTVSHPYTLNDDDVVIAMMPKFVGNFVGLFPNIMAIRMYFENSGAAVMDLASILALSFGNQLKTLVCGQSISILQSTVAQLTTLECLGEWHTLSCINLQPLESLTVRYGPTVGFSWSLFRRDNSPDSSVLVFPNLTNLELRPVTNNTKILRPVGIGGSGSPLLKFPKLQHLIFESYDDRILDFKVDLIP